MRPTKYSCSKCAFSGTTISTWGPKLYHNEGVEVSVNAFPGICYDCNGITPVEKLPSLQTLKSLEGKDKKINGFRVPLEKYYEEEKLRLNLLKDRKLAEKCLKCGGTDIMILLDENLKSGVEHRGCGGMISSEVEEYSLTMGVMPTTYYDTEGNRIN